MKKHTYLLILLCVYIAAFIWSAIEPTYRSVWVAESILPVVFVLGLTLTYKKFRFSNAAYTLMFIFMILHTIGAHYTYNEVPLFDMLQDKYDLSRNHYDRVIHFLFGVLFFLPLYEIISRRLNQKGWFVLVITALVLVGWKAIFELVEYGYGVTQQGHLLDTHYVGMQGDIWDAQKDILLGTIGAIINVVTLGLFSKR